MSEATPFYFGPPETQLFGWWHRSTSKENGGVGLVICNPFGFEEVCAHRSLRALAVTASEAGFPTIRFDYAGCGNSGGDEFEPGTLARWIDSVHLAAETLKHLSSVSLVIFFGVRFGATLASLAAIARNDVVGLMALSPVVQGRHYLRELRILGEASAIRSPVSVASNTILEAGGFFLTSSSVDAITEIDLRELKRVPAQNILIVERDDISSYSHWPETLSNFGANISVERWPGYAAMMTEPQSSKIPEFMIENMVRTMNSWASNLEIANSPQSIKAPAVPDRVTNSKFELDGVVETAIQFDVGATKLFGILCDSLEHKNSAASERGKSRSCVVLLNSGSVHHIGPNRLWVQLARRWASQGHAVLRIDLSGIGDSPPRNGAVENVVYSEEAEKDIACALQYLQIHVNTHAYHLVGLCSGAFHAFKAAVSGQPINSVIAINPLTFFWKPGTPLNADIKQYEVDGLTSSYLQRITSVESWQKVLKGKADFNYLLQFLTLRMRTLAQPYWNKLTKTLGRMIEDDLENELKLAANNGILQRFVFAQDDPGLALLNRQGAKYLHSLIDQQRVTIDILPDSDHTFTRLEARGRLIALLDNLVLQNQEAT